MPPAAAATGAARAAVTEPQEEADATANKGLVATLDERPPPSPEIEELCQKIYKAIKDKRPPDEDSLLESKPEEAAAEAGGQLWYEDREGGGACFVIELPQAAG